MLSLQRNLDIDLLRALVAIADCGSFSAAGAKLGRTQSAVSLQIKRLEDAVGQVLLTRSQGRVLGPTAEGRILIDYARRILRLNDEACSCFTQPVLAGRLRVGLPEELMENVFPAVLAEFSQSFPRVEISLRCDLSVRLAALVADGELDLAIAKRMAPIDGRDEAGEWQVLRRDPLVWVTGEGSNAVDERPLPLAVFHEGCVFRMAAIAALAAHDIPWRAAFVGSSFASLRHALMSGMAVAALPRSLAAPGLLESLHSLPPLPESELVARFGPGEVLPAARHLVALLQQRLRS